MSLPMGLVTVNDSELMTALNQGFSRRSEAEPENYCRQSEERATRNLQLVLRSQVELEVQNVDPHVASLLRMTGLKD